MTNIFIDDVTKLQCKYCKAIGQWTKKFDSVLDNDITHRLVFDCQCGATIYQDKEDD